MNILYCRIGWMTAYCGNTTEKPQGGGKYNVENIGHEVHNYLGFDGKYYGFVEAGIKNSIHVEKLGADKKADSAEDVLIVWVARKPSGGEVIVGWYENATVFRVLQTVPDDAMTIRSLKSHTWYNIYSEHVLLLDVADRKFRIDRMGRSNIWYGDNDFDVRVIDYIRNYGNDYNERIEAIEKGTQDLVGDTKEAVVKVRINQDKFRKGLLEKYKCKCCLCGVNEDSLLIASHIKPWVDSDEHEKLDLNNGLLLCPNHDRLFDKGYISFDDDGSVIISDRLSEVSKLYMNINEKMSIMVNDDNIQYIQYHKKHIFENGLSPE